MFLVEGLLASVVGLIVFFTLTDSPEKAAWLEPEERTALTAAIAAEDREKQARHGVSSILQGLLNWRILYLAAIYFLIQAAVYGVVYYLPPQVGRLLGRNVGLIVGLVTAIPWACALAASYFLPRLAEKLGKRRQIGALTMLACAIGMALSVLLAPTPLLALAALCIAVAGFIAVQPLFWTFPTAYLGGAAAASGLALVNTLGASAGFVSPLFRLWAEEKFGSGAGLYALSLTTMAGAAMILATGRMLGRRD
jgi:sugar phosphate permease